MRLNKQPTVGQRIYMWVGRGRVGVYVWTGTKWEVCR